MKKLYYLTILSFVFIVCNAQNCYYWSGGQKIWLDTDSSRMLVRFDNEQNLQSFAATTPEVSLFPGKTMALVDMKTDSFRQKILYEKPVIKKTFAHKFSGSDIPYYLTGDIVMQPKNDVSAQTILSKFRVNGQIVKKTGTGIVIVRLEDWNSITDVANSIYESGLVEWCHPDFITKIERTTNDPFFLQQYYLKNTGQDGGMVGLDIKAEEAWNIMQSSSNIRVAVIDDGVEEHEDLSGRVLQGYTPLNPIGYGRPTTQVFFSPKDVIIGHGEACAGIIAASHNTLGIAGIAPNVQIVPINIFDAWAYDLWYIYGYGYYYDYFPTTSVQDIADAIEYAWNPSKGDADVISNSWGYSNNIPPINADYINQEINNAINLGRLRNGNRLGCVVVFSSGNNDSYVNYPASLPDVIAVGAIDRCGVRAGRIDVVPNSCDPWCPTCQPGSAYGSDLDVVAFGTNIYTIDRKGDAGYNTASGTAGNYDCCFGGTSAACPQVAGIVSLILSANSNLKGQHVRDIIESTAQKINQYSPSNLSGYVYTNNPTVRPNGTWNNEIGYGLVDAYAAVQKAVACATTTVNFTSQTVSAADETVTSCGDIYVKDVTVTNNKKLTLEASGMITIDGDFEVQLGSEFEIK